MSEAVTIERYLVEVLAGGSQHGILSRRSYRGTCMRCGSAIRDFDSVGMLAAHTCMASVGVFASENSHWREIVRDAFLNGRDAEAIEIICHEMNLVPP